MLSCHTAELAPWSLDWHCGIPVPTWIYVPLGAGSCHQVTEARQKYRAQSQSPEAAAAIRPVHLQ